MGVGWLGRAPFPRRRKGGGRSGGDDPRRPPAPSRLTGTSCRSYSSYPAAWRVSVWHVLRTCRGCRGRKGVGQRPTPIQSANLPISQNAPAGIQGAAPLEPQSPNLPIPLCPLCPLVPFVVNPPWPSCVRQHAPDLPQSAESAVSLRRAVLCESLYFSVALCVSKLSPAPTGGKVRGR